MLTTHEAEHRPATLDTTVCGTTVE